MKLTEEQFILLRTFFHGEWGKAKTEENYSKENWLILQDLLIILTGQNV